MVQSYSSGQRDAAAANKSGKYPPTRNLNVGESVVAMALKVGETIWNGKPRVVVEAVIRGEPDDKSFTIWWPKNLAVPPLLKPFLLYRLAQWKFDLKLGSNDEEHKLLWTTGNFGGEAAAAVMSGSAASPDAVKAALAQFAPAPAAK